MILKASNIILFIHPSEEKLDIPIIDDLTLKIAFAIENGKTGVVVCELDKETGTANIARNIMTMGYHVCRCGAYSKNADYEIADNLYINSLGAHYVAFHRKDVCVEDLEKIAKLNYEKDYVPKEWVLKGRRVDF
jgi:hypothetical protein